MKSKMKRTTVCVLTVALIAILLGACSPDSSQASATVSTPAAIVSATPTVTSPATISATPSPSPSVTASASPSANEFSDEDLKGTHEGQTYKNTAAGFEMTYPEDYEVYLDDKIMETMAENIDYIDKNVTDPQEHRIVMQQSIPVSMASKQTSEIYGGANILIVDMSDDLPTNIVEYTDEVANNIISQSDTVSSVEKAVPTKIDGVDAASLDCVQNVGDLTAQQRQYFFLRGNLLVIITISSTDEDEFNKLIKMSEALKMN